MTAKKMLATLLTVVMLLACVTPALAAEPAYLSRGEAAAMLLAAADDYNPGVRKSDILRGYDDGSLREEETVTRAQALVMLSRAFGDLPAPVGGYALAAYDASGFADVPSWAAAELANVLQSGIVEGASATALDPDAPMTRGQMERFISRVYALEGSNLKDDFYAAVNREYLITKTLQPGYGRINPISDLSIQTAAAIEEIIREISRTGGTTDGERKIAALYQNILDWDSRNAAGITPIQPYLDAVDAASSAKELLAVDIRLNKELASQALFGFSIGVDNKNSSNKMLYYDIMAPSLGQGGYDEAVKAIYLDYVSTLLKIGGQTPEEAARQARLCWDAESVLAAAMLTVQDQYDIDKTYNIYTLDQLQEMFPAADLRGMLASTGLKDTGRICVMDKGLLGACAELYRDENLDALKALYRFSLLDGFGDMLSEELNDAGKAFLEAYKGVESADDETVAAGTVQNFLVEYLGPIYVERCFSASMKAEVEAIVQDLLATYRERIKALDWMSEATKERALRKLDTMKIHIGYPDEWQTYLKDTPILTADQGGSFFQNVAEIGKTYQALVAAEQDQPVDKDAWEMPPYIVNACYIPVTNTIEFPAGILQAPFYDANASYEANLGGIGYVIGHEITHAFDNNGAKYDETGNAADWWTDDDYAKFEALCQRVVAYYDGREAEPGVLCDGALTLSENVADLGALACVTQIVAGLDNPDFEALYRSAAGGWATVGARDYLLYLARTDVHAPARLRGSLVLQSCDKFYETFGITEGDGMWIAPEERVSIW